MLARVAHSATQLDCEGVSQTEHTRSKAGQTIHDLQSCTDRQRNVRGRRTCEAVKGKVANVQRVQGDACAQVRAAYPLNLP